GMFANDSSYQSDILTQLTITFALWAVVWALLSHDGRTDEVAVGGQPMTRRYAVASAGWTVLALGSIGAVIASLVDMFRTPGLTEAEKLAQEQAVDQIVADQRATAAASPPASPAADAPLSGQALFDSLDASGDLTPILTATKDFYHVSKNFTDPTVSADGWMLEIGGLVNTPLSFTHDELMARAATQKITTLCCISNELNGDLIGTAEWTGIPLMELLNEAGVKPEAVDLKFSAADDYTDSVPVAIGQDPDVMLVVGMNGEVLPDDHGFPARLIVPPIYGMKNVKWLQKIEAVDHDYKGYWQERGWSDPAPYQIWGRIDRPYNKIQPGPFVACGVASAGDRGVQRVEVSLDDGATWGDAELEPALNPPLTWVRWAFPFEAVSGRHKMRIRVTDGTGDVMKQESNPPLPDGATGWPSRTVTVE
ncbi:MAG: molybdopterin-dependent oxidoreductase, partial [Chloroflexota bacterium]|nr:molybdopterin-dependent oxidoreductase [Chloroflexota bacterium]